jgi:molybdenum cofactor cytidylyltransferase
MGRAKAALPLGQTGETVVSRVIRTLLQGGVPDVVVVSGAHVDAVRAAMPAFAEATAGKPGTARARVVEHAGWQDGQLSSLLAGLAAIDEPLLEAALVSPVDVPLVQAATVSAVIEAWRRTRAPIVRPIEGATGASGATGATGAVRHGHPVIFDRSVFEDLRAADSSVGAKAVFARHRDRVLNVEVKDPGAFEDIDTPEDYEKVLGL